MNISKKIPALILVLVMIAGCFAGCSFNKEETYSDQVCILGYTDSVEPFLTVDESGKASGFIADLWESIFKEVKGDLKSYRYEKVETGYTLEESGGFFDSSNKEYSAALLLGAVSKNSGTFNKDYSYTEPIITNRVIAVTTKDSKIKTYSDFAGVNLAYSSIPAADALTANKALVDKCKSIKECTVEEGLQLLKSGEADVFVVDEFSFMPCGSVDEFVILDGEVDCIEYVIACAKNSGWKDSLNEAIREMKSSDYGDGDTFTPLVEKYFGYNASSFNYTTAGDK